MCRELWVPVLRAKQTAGHSGHYSLVCDSRTQKHQNDQKTINCSSFGYNQAFKEKIRILRRAGMEKGRRNEGGGARKKTTKHAPALRTPADAASEISLSVLAPLRAILMGRRSVGRRAFAPCRLFRQARRSRMREEAPGEGGKEGREGREGREKEEMSTIPLNNALGTDAEAKHQKCTSTCEGRPTPTPLVKGGEGRQGLDPGIIRSWPPRLASHNRKKGDGQDTPCLLQGKTLGSYKPSSIGEEGEGRQTQEGDEGEEGEGRKQQGAA